MAKNQFLNWGKVQNCQKCNFTKKFFLDLFVFTSLFAWTLLNFLARCVLYRFEQNYFYTTRHFRGTKNSVIQGLAVGFFKSIHFSLRISNPCKINVGTSGTTDRKISLKISPIEIENSTYFRTTKTRWEVFTMTIENV